MTNYSAAPATIHIAGNSGCVVRVVREGAEVVLEKAATDTRYSSRLKLQIAKQEACRQLNPLPFVRVPKIIKEQDVAGIYSATMDYVYFHNSVEFFASASRPAIDRVAEMILAFVDAEVARSPLAKLPTQVFQEKVDSVARALHDNNVGGYYADCVARLGRQLAQRSELELPLGTCHGDLTFSNIMIASDTSGLALIDFLDSFVDSPLLDIAKLRQDTRFHWTKLFGVEIGSGTRFSQVMGYLDRRIVEHYAGQRWYAENIDIVLFLNMLRIAPYAKTAAIHEFVLKSMESIRFKDD